MKSILLPVEPHGTMQAVFDTALLLAQRNGARVEGVALKPSVVDFIAPDPVVVVLPQPHWNEGEAPKVARRLFDEYAESHAAAIADGTSGMIWRGTPPIEDGGLGSLGRLFDITVLGRPGLGRAEPRMTTFEAALFESGRPILMAPPKSPKTFGTNVLIHWNASVETSRVLRSAMDLLKKAERVTVLTVEGHTVPGPKASELLGYLANHGITATELSAPGGGRPGEVILSHAKKFGCDLLIKGAYTQSRLRQMIFGGATNHILQAAEIPVFWQH